MNLIIKVKIVNWEILMMNIGTKKMVRNLKIREISVWKKGIINDLIWWIKKFSY